MPTVNIEVDAKELEIGAGDYKTVILKFKAEANSVLNNFSVSDILDHFDKDELLETIGEKHARQYFEIEEVSN